jgi:hypothetical protein
MKRRLYILMLRLHPRMFRQRFGDEMLGIFEQSSGKISLLADACQSLFRQWALRPHPVALSATATPDGVPLFYSAAPEIPRASAFLPGAFVTLVAFCLIYLAMGHQWRQTRFIVGSHHPSPSHILGARTEARPVADLPAEIKVKPYQFHPPVSPYFRFLLVLGALDLDQDNIISAAELENAPAALWRLDTNHDGVLSAEECGLKPDANIDPQVLGRMRLAFMRIHPVLAVLDANQDGKISADEIRNAARALRRLDTNGDGKLEEREVNPDRAVLMASNVMISLDANGDGRISASERTGPLAARLRHILDRADRDGKGYITEEDLVIAISSGRP